jgi:hypothetical protein
MRRLLPVAFAAAALAAAGAGAQEPQPGEPPPTPQPQEPQPADPAPPPQPPPERLPEGAMIAGVPLGGLGPHAAKVELRRVLKARYGRPIQVRVRRRRVTVRTSTAGQYIRYEAMIRRAFGLARDGQPVDVPLMRTISSTKLTATVVAIARAHFKPPRNARVRFGLRRIARIPGRHGLAVDRGRLRRALLDELRRPHERRVVRARMVRVRPRISGRDLRRIHHTYISVDRRHFIVRLFKRLRRVRSYRVAVGAAGYDTPRGLHRVISKQRNPAWHVPNRPWAGSLAGQTIPPGDPRNPLKAAFIGIGRGIGFHGTADLGSIGRRASHGCIRMRVPDVLNLYARTPIGTPVLVR